jgi:hypothetical protein
MVNVILPNISLLCAFMLNVVMQFFLLLNFVLMNVILLNFVLLTVIVLNVILHSVFLLNVILLNVVVQNVILLMIILPNVVLLNVVQLKYRGASKTDDFVLEISFRQTTNLYKTFLGEGGVTLANIFTLTGSVKANGSKPKSCFGRVFNFKLGCFAS